MSDHLPPIGYHGLYRAPVDFDTDAPRPMTDHEFYAGQEIPPGGRDGLAFGRGIKNAFIIVALFAALIALFWWR